MASSVPTATDLKFVNKAKSLEEDLRNILLTTGEIK
jgi:hypothetical protein